MSKICYIEKSFRPAALALIEHANGIIAEYQAQGFDLTLRQLYYQFVSRGLLANKQTEYDRLGALISDARLAGLVDWDSITDRTRFVRERTHWVNPRQILRAAAQGYALDMWENQPVRVLVMIEKDALVGVIEGVCTELDVPFFSCRGYVSQSEMYAQARRLKGYMRAGQQPLILHLGDHDPSGMDMTRDIRERMALFLEDERFAIELKRLALNMPQITRYNPPPNPTKLTDSRAVGYMSALRAAGFDPNTSWELDALEPSVIAGLIRTAVLSLRDETLWAEMTARQEQERGGIEDVIKLYKPREA